MENESAIKKTDCIKMPIVGGSSLHVICTCITYSQVLSVLKVDKGRWGLTCRQGALGALLAPSGVWGLASVYNLLEGLRSVVSSPSGVRGKALAGNAFW
jgi:hypothetical protein